MLVTGTITIKQNGKSLRCKDGSGEMDLGGFEREMVMADGQVIGPKRKPVPSKVKATFVHTSDTDMQSIADMEDGTILFQTDSGKKYTIRNAATTKSLVLKAGGDMDCEFEGKPAVES